MPTESIAQGSGDVARERMDQVNAARGIDMQNRLTMLRALRENKAPKDDVTAFELGAVGLLQAMQLENLSKESASRVVVMKVADTMASYRRDFPDSEFDPVKRPAVARLLSVTSK